MEEGEVKPVQNTTNMSVLKSIPIWLFLHCSFMQAVPKDFNEFLMIWHTPLLQIYTVAWLNR